MEKFFALQVFCGGKSTNYQWIPSINSQQCKGYYGFFIVNLDKLLNTQSSLLWFNCNAIPLKWRHYYGISGTYGIGIYRVLHTSRCLVSANPLAFNEPIDFLSQALVGHITCAKVIGSTISYRIPSLGCVSLPPIFSCMLTRSVQRDFTLSRRTLNGAIWSIRTFLNRWWSNTFRRKQMYPVCQCCHCWELSTVHP